MSKQAPLGILSDQYDPGVIRRACVFSALFYPLWHLIAPESAWDPWALWWLVGGAFALVAVLPTFSGFARRNLQSFFYAIFFAVGTQFFVLAHVNDMHPFYAIGSVMGVFAICPVIRKMGVFLSYAGYLLLLGFTLFALAPSWEKVAFWGPPLLVFLPFCYYQLRSRLEAAELVRRSHEGLEHRVTERTLELSQTNATLRRTMAESAKLEEQLRFSQKMEAVGRLAGGVAHDFNNLLTAIRGYGDLVLDALPEDHPAREDVQEMEDAAERAAALTRQLLAFSRESTTQTTLVDMNAVIQKMAPMMKTLMGEDMELVMRLSEGVRLVRANRAQLEQVILNLALNARDAMPGGGTFTLETTEIDRADGDHRLLPPELKRDVYVLLAATDSGIGMDEETRGRVFEPFFTTKNVDEGTGMGLATVYGIVKQAAGGVRVLSELGKGARFELYWPAEKGDAEPEEIAPAQPIAARGSECILLVEDEGAVRRLARRVLEGCGYSVLEAREPEAALRMALDLSLGIDLIVTDVVMPKMSGFELAEKLAGERPEIKVLFISGHLDHPSLRSRPLPSGTVLLPKPFSPTDLSTAVRNALDS